MNYEELNTGWLAPDGNFFPCHSYDHNAEAKELVGKFKYESIDKKEHKIIHDDDILMNHGWVYVGTSSFFSHEWRIGWNKFLTEYQKQFLRPYFEESEIPVDEFSVYRWERENE